MGRRCVSLLTRLSVRFIASDENGEIQPTRILNVSTEESYDLYENRFVYHLIQRLFTFVDKRTDVIFWSTGDETCNTMSMESKVDDAYEEISYKIEMTIKNRQSYAENDSDHMEVFMNDELRKTLMPVANKYSIEELMDACRYYVDKTSRRITYEYSLVKGVNDGKEQALELIHLIKGMNCHVNLIPVNPIKERDFKQTEGPQISSFKNLLEKNGIACTIRREMGRDIDGACGQLRKSHLDEDNAE